MVKICFISNINVLDGEFAFWDKEKCSAFPLEINTFHHHPDLSTTGGGGVQSKIIITKITNRAALTCTPEQSQFNPIFFMVISRAVVSEVRLPIKAFSVPWDPVRNVNSWVLP